LATGIFYFRWLDKPPTTGSGRVSPHYQFAFGPFLLLTLPLVCSEGAWYTEDAADGRSSSQLKSDNDEWRINDPNILQLPEAIDQVDTTRGHPLTERISTIDLCAANGPIIGLAEQF
jgi:hypothetical protein